MHGEQSIRLHGAVPCGDCVDHDDRRRNVRRGRRPAWSSWRANPDVAGRLAFWTRTSLFIAAPAAWWPPRPRGDEETTLVAKAVADREADEVVTSRDGPDQALLFRLERGHNRCVRIRPWPSVPSGARSCTGSARTASRGGHFSTPSAVSVRRASARCGPLLQPTMPGDTLPDGRCRTSATSCRVATGSAPSAAGRDRD